MFYRLVWFYAPTMSSKTSPAEAVASFAEVVKDLSRRCQEFADRPLSGVEIQTIQDFGGILQDAAAMIGPHLPVYYSVDLGVLNQVLGSLKECYSGIREASKGSEASIAHLSLALRSLQGALETLEDSLLKAAK